MTQPNEHHEKLVRRQGTWEGTSTSVTPDGTETVKRAVERVVAFGDYFARSHFVSGPDEPGSYIGYGHHSYDPWDGLFVETWINNYSAQLVCKRGNYDADRNMIVVRWEERDETGKMVPQHSEEVREPGSYVKSFFWDGRLYARLEMTRVSGAVDDSRV